MGCSWFNVQSSRMLLNRRGAGLLLVGIAQVMIGFVLPFYLQDVLRLTPTFIGLLFISA
jgi:hypothetical protein